MVPAAAERLRSILVIIAYFSSFVGDGVDIAELKKCHDDFKATLQADVDSLIRLHANDSTGTGRPGEWLTAIRRSAIVLIAANLENFIESLICAALGYLADQKLVARRYPERFRLWLFREDANMRNIGIEDSRDFITLTLKLYSDVRPLEKSELKLDTLRDAFANPTPSSVTWLIALLDLDSYLDDVTLTVEGKDTNAKGALGELAKRRNDIAHGDATQKPDIEDVERLRKFCLLFSNRLYKDVTKATNSYFAKK